MLTRVHWLFKKRPHVSNGIRFGLYDKAVAPVSHNISSLSFCTAQRLLLQHPLLSFFFIRETSTLIFHLFYFMLIKLFIALNYRYSFCYHTLCNAKTHVHIITTMISTELIVVQLPLRLEMSDYWETI